MNKRNILSLFLFAFVFLFLEVSPVFANLEMVKLYKNTFGTDDKPKCACCHTDKIPKKDEGKHDLNDYGKKLKAAKPADKAMPDEETLKKVGKNEKAEE